MSTTSNKNQASIESTGIMQASPLSRFQVKEDVPDAMAKIATLESIDRLGDHLPQVVIDQIIASLETVPEYGGAGAGGEDTALMQLMNSKGGVGGSSINVDNSSSHSISHMTLNFPTMTTTPERPSCKDDDNRVNPFMSTSLESMEEALDELFDGDNFSSDDDSDSDSDSDSDDSDFSSDDSDEDEEEAPVVSDMSCDGADRQAQPHTGSCNNEEAGSSVISCEADEQQEQGPMGAASPEESSEDGDDSSSCSSGFDEFLDKFCPSVAALGSEAILGTSANGLPITSTLSFDSNHLAVNPGDTTDESDVSSYSSYSEDMSCSSSSDGDDSNSYNHFDHFCLSVTPQTKHDEGSFNCTTSNAYNGTGSICSSSNPKIDNRPSMAAVGKLRQGRLNNRRMESDASNDERSMMSQSISDTRSFRTPVTAATSQTRPMIDADCHEGSLLFVDISGFTVLSRSLQVEALSKVINAYFQEIVDEIKAYGGDILKFAGDALLVEWRQGMIPSNQQYEQSSIILLASLCASKLVSKCSDYPVVTEEGDQVAMLNLHCAVGYGNIVGAHVGDMDRMEYIVLGDCIRQISNGMDQAKLGEVVASPEVIRCLQKAADFDDNAINKEGEYTCIAFKDHQKFQTLGDFVLPANLQYDPVSSRCSDWSLDKLEDLQRKMSRYVHSVVYSDEFEFADEAGDRCNTSSRKTEAELRNVFTVFIQPEIKSDLKNDEAAFDQETLQVLNSIMFIVNTEVTHFKAHLRQFIVDDKGLVVIANFGLRGSTFPNMIEERAIPCITNIKTLLKTELDLECKMGATMEKAYCGVVGGKERHEYAILGPSVNLAARLMASASNPGILVDEAVKLKAGDRPFNALPPVKAKGYDTLVKIFNPEENVGKSWKDISGQFVARAEEIENIKETAQSVVDEATNAKCIFVSGPYGIGKSCILSQAAREIETACRTKDTPCHISRFVFSEKDSFKTFSIVRPIFLDILRRKQHIPSFGQASKAGHFEDIEPTAIEEASLYVSLLQICLEAKVPMPFIEVLAGLIFSNKLSDIGTWSDKNRKMKEWKEIAHHFVTAFLHCTKEYKLVLMALDDVCGLDEMSWEILHHLYQKSNNLLVVCTARNEFDLNINGEFWSELNEEGIPEGRYCNMRLQPMKEEDVNELACCQLGKTVEELDDTISKTVHAQSKGNPLLACKILDVMYKNYSEDASGEVLGKIGELLLNCLDELSPVVRSHLSLASLLGVSFKETDIIVVMKEYNKVEVDSEAVHAASVHSSLQEAVGAGILKYSGGCEETTYTFSHTLWIKTIELIILDGWKEEMRALIEHSKKEEVATTIVHDLSVEEEHVSKSPFIDTLEAGNDASHQHDLDEAPSVEVCKLASHLADPSIKTDRNMCIEHDWDEVPCVEACTASLAEYLRTVGDISIEMDWDLALQTYGNASLTCDGDWQPNIMAGTAIYMNKVIMLFLLLLQVFFAVSSYTWICKFCTLCLFLVFSLGSMREMLLGINMVWGGKLSSLDISAATGDGSDAFERQRLPSRTSAPVPRPRLTRKKRQGQRRRLLKKPGSVVAVAA